VIDGVIDGAAKSAVATVTVGINPQRPAVNPTIEPDLCRQCGGNTVTVIDGPTNQEKIQAA